MSTNHSSFLIHSVCPEFGRIMRPSATENSSACRWICHSIRPSVSEIHSARRRIFHSIRPSFAEIHSACRLFALFVRALALTLSCSLEMACQRVTLTDDDNPPSSPTPTVTHREEVLLATNDTARFYLQGVEVSGIVLEDYPTPSLLITDHHYRLPTRLEVAQVLKFDDIPEGYWQSGQRILCYDVPTDADIKVGSTIYGTGDYYTFMPHSTVTRAGMKTKYCILPIRSELRTPGNSIHITINDEWKEY